MKLAHLLFSFFIVLVASFFLTIPAFSTSPILEKAQSRGEDLSKEVDFEVANSRDLQNVISNGINVTLSILGVISVLLIVYAGGLWLTAAGSDEKIGQAKKIIRAVIVGVVIAGFAYAIATFIITVLLG